MENGGEDQDGGRGEGGGAEQVQPESTQLPTDGETGPTNQPEEPPPPPPLSPGGIKKEESLPALPPSDTTDQAQSIKEEGAQEDPGQESTAPPPVVENDAVNLKVKDNPSGSPEQQPEEHSHHVRTITLTSDYRQQEQHQHNNLIVYSQQPEDQQQQEAVESQNAPPDGDYYQTHEGDQHYSEDNSGRYQEVSGPSVTKMELLNAAAAEAGVPTGHYTIMVIITPVVKQEFALMKLNEIYNDADGGR